MLSRNQAGVKAIWRRAFSSISAVQNSSLRGGGLRWRFWCCRGFGRRFLRFRWRLVLRRVSLRSIGGSGFGLWSLWLGSFCLMCLTYAVFGRSEFGRRWPLRPCRLLSLQLGLLCLQQLLPLPLQLLHLLLTDLPYHGVSKDLGSAGLSCLGRRCCLYVLDLWLAELLLWDGSLRYEFLCLGGVGKLLESLLFVGKRED